MSYWFIVAGLLGALALVLDAFGAHGLKVFLGEKNVDVEHMIYLWQTATKYQMWHAIFIAIVAGSYAKFPHSLGFVIMLLATLGVIFFSGAIYFHVITGIEFLRKFTPLGGMMLILAWVGLCFYAFVAK